MIILPVHFSVNLDIKNLASKLKPIQNFNLLTVSILTAVLPTTVIILAL